MYIFLVQHGDALSAEVNVERPLSDKGRMQVEHLSDFLKRLPYYPSHIMHSGKKRALETAEIISYTLGGIKMEERGYLNPNDNPDKLIFELNRAKDHVMVVGHMPFLWKLLAELLGLKQESAGIDIQMASPVILNVIEGGYALETYIKNEYLK